MTNKYIFVLLFICLASCKDNIDYYYISTKSDTNYFNAVVEISAGTNKKFEYNKKTRKFEIDRKNGTERIIDFLPYIGNYGFIPSTYSDILKGGDGDALDVLVLSESLPTETVVEIVPIAVLKLIDDGELDYKIIANVAEIMKIIELWFLNYNKDDTALIEGWDNEN